jgi:hypothetical protein
MSDEKQEQYTRSIRITREFEVSSKDPLITLDIQEIFSTEQGKKVDVRLINSHIEILDPANSKEEQEA